MNAPDRLDSIVVPAGLAKVQVSKEEKMNNAVNYRILREDHTLGHLLRMELLRDPQVRFAGYKHPHPLENDIVVKVQTVSSTTHTPTDALKASAKRLEDVFMALLADYRAAAAKIRSADAAL